MVELAIWQMDIVRPTIPLQSNGTDCGLYLLHYIEEVFRDPKKYCYPENLQDLGKWFSEETVNQKRFMVAKLIREISMKQNPNETIEFPSLSLLPPVIPKQKVVIEVRLLDYDGHVKM